MFRSMKKSSSVKHLVPNGLTFSIFSEEEIKKMSVVKITTPLSFNTLGHPYKSGLYDPALGPTSEKSDPCTTCSRNVYNCPGHFGHIELPIPAVNPLFRKAIHCILKLACLGCHFLQIKDLMKYVYITKLKLLNKGYFVESQEVDDIVAEVLCDGAKHMEPVIKKKLDEYYETCLKEKGDEESGDKLANTQIIESQINSIISTMEKSKPDHKHCTNCNNPLRNVRLFKKRFMTTGKKSELGQQQVQHDGEKTVSTLILPDEIRTHLRKIWDNEKDFIMALVPALRNFTMEYPTDGFFISVIAVPPPKMRPVKFAGNMMVEHPQSEAFKEILNDCILLHIVINSLQDDGTKTMPVEGKVLLEQIRGKTLIEKLNTAYEEMQTNVDFLVDNHQQYMKKRVSPGIKQVIEKKSGVIRMHMMGKRVDFAARTVITPDPYLNIQEIGIPEAFATTLTYPTPVTAWNVSELRQMVHRHLCTGDVLLLNRQPTLHRPGIMAHVARILKGEKTFRMHYANCKAYNADFDGDEMNAHFPQNEIARSEAYNLYTIKLMINVFLLIIVNVQKQYLVPKDGTPLSGLIQDHIIGGVRLSVRGKFFGREDYHQLVYEALSYKKKEIKLLPPTILKPRVLWSGKQILSTVIINVIPEGQVPLNLTSKAKISDQAWTKQKRRRWVAGGTPFKEHSMSEAEVIIREGELLCGVLDKTHYGATPYGLVHCLNEIYGGSCSSNILSAFSKLFNAFLQRDGFTLGIEDILVLGDAEKKRKDFVINARKIGDKAVRQALDLPEMATSDEVKEKMEEIYQNKARGRAIVDSSYKEHLDECTNKINKTCIPGGLRKSFPQNNLQLMIQSGAKGSTVNAMQISCLLGQIELEGRRPPHMISGKNLPSFAKYDTTPRAGGFIDGRFLTGIKPQEFFYHCMAGREGLIDTAVKTSRSGYLQRCLVKHLEGLVVRYTNESRRCPDPVSADFQVDRDFGAITEQLDLLMTDYLKTRTCEHKKEFRNMMYVKSMQASSQPGDPVGLLAAQMTLNTFHFAGRGEMNVTLGIPRLRELLMTASKSIKTPYLEVPFNMDVPNIQKKANKLKVDLCRVTVADVLQFIKVSDKLLVHNERQHMYEIHLQFLPRKAYKSKFCVKPSDILKHVEKCFIKYMFSVFMKALNIKHSLIHVQEDSSAKRKKSNNGNDSDEDEPDADMGQESRNYDVDLGENHESSDEEKEVSEDEGIEDDDEEKQNKSSRGIADESLLENDVETPNENNSFEKLPVKYKRIDLTSLLKDTVAKSVIWEMPLIKRAITFENADTQNLTLKTEGINFQEIQNVFKVYGIEVDPRHLLLVADYMTFNGTIKPFSRKSIEDNVSPLQQMSFESSVNFLRMALSRGKRDDLQSPSSRLMLGQPSVGGTGCFSILYKLPQIKDLGF
ncbi:hypothetical protein C0J52_06198 [Blattella germanica]|nr:hypothetical protein C0J52_06198 [Blattella germanica]